MSWLLELLLDGIREICSQFIVDMMELITKMFTELLSCDLSLFESLFSVVSVLYRNVIVPMGIAILLLILVWQLFKSMFGKSVNGEEPIELLIRSAISLFFVVMAKPLVNYVLKVAGTPYQWVVGTEIVVESFSGFVSALEGVTETLGIGKLSISLLMLLMQFVVAWNYFKMLFVIAERYVLLGVFSYTAPLAFATGGSKATNNILASWAKMFGGQVVLIIMNAWCMKMFLSGYGNMMASSYGFTKFFVATLCLVGFCKITFKLDTYLASLGVNLGRPSAGMGAMGLIMAASRVLSQIGRGSTGDGGSPSGGDASTSGTMAGSSMTEGFAGPIPMMPGENMEQAMEMSEMPEEKDFGEAAETATEAENTGDFSSYEASAGGKSVLEELGVIAADGSGSAGIDPGFGTDTGHGIGRTGETGFGNGSEEKGTNRGMEESGAKEAFGKEETPMDMNFAGIPAYGEEASLADETAFGENAGISERESSEEVMTMESGCGNGGSGIISEIGDYPVEEILPGTLEEHGMELDKSAIESMGSGMETGGVSCGSAADSYGSMELARSGVHSFGDRQTSRGKGVAGAGMETVSFSGNKGNSGGEEHGWSGGDDGVFSEMGVGFDTGTIDSYGTAKETGAGPAGSKSIGDAAVRDFEESGTGGVYAKTGNAPSGDHAGVLAEMGVSGSAAGISSGMETSLKQNGSSNTIPLSGRESEREDPYEEKEGDRDFDIPKETADQELNPFTEMNGQMNQLDSGSTIPSEEPARGSRMKPSREFREVPKTREELRRRQQEKKGETSLK